MKILILISFMVFSITYINAQQSEKKSKQKLKAELKARKINQIRELIDSENFIFKAETVNPANSSTKTLRTDFGIEVRNDSVFSYMPYYGKTYIRDYGTNNESPMGFIQPILKYNRKRSKKGYTINIKVTNKYENIELKFHILKTGYTSVSASFLDRQSISYYGEILVPLPREEEAEKENVGK